MAGPWQEVDWRVKLGWRLALGLISMGLDKNWQAFYSTAAGRGHRVCVAHCIHCVGVWHPFRWSSKRQRGREGETERWWEGEEAKTEMEEQQREETLIHEELLVTRSPLCHFGKVSAVRSADGSSANGQRAAKHRQARPLLRYSLRKYPSLSPRSSIIQLVWIFPLYVCVHFYTRMFVISTHRTVRAIHTGGKSALQRSDRVCECVYSCARISAVTESWSVAVTYQGFLSAQQLDDEDQSAGWPLSSRQILSWVTAVCKVKGEQKSSLWGLTGYHLL